MPVLLEALQGSDFKPSFKSAQISLEGLLFIVFLECLILGVEELKRHMPQDSKNIFVPRELIVYLGNAKEADIKNLNIYTR